MDLWVRSQDKTRLVKVCSLEYGEYNEIHYINGYCVNEIDNYDLGTYKTKERALEILEEIEDLMRSLNSSDLKIIIYEMPKE